MSDPARGGAARPPRWRAAFLPPPRFVPPALEASFTLHYRAAGLDSVRVAAALATLLCCLLAFVIDRGNYGAPSMRSGAFVLLAVVFATAFLVMTRHRDWVLQHYVFVVGVPSTLAVGVTAALWLANADPAERAWLQASAAMIFISLVIAAFTRLPVALCAMLAAAGNTIYALGLAVHDALNPALGVYHLLTAITAVALCAEVERRERLVFTQMRALAAASAAKSSVLTAASHDLRQPLMGMSLHLGALERSAAAQDPTVARTIARLAGCAQAMEASLSRLLQVERLAIPSERPVLGSVDLQSIFGQLRAVHEPVASRHGVALRVAPPPRRARLVTSNADRLLDILSNLVDNAIKFSKPGARAPRVTVRAVGIGARVAVSVRDNGRGIDPADHARIFEQHVRVGPSTQPGYGLGLAMVAQTVALLDGHAVGVKSRLGRGARFVVSMPVAGPRDAVPPVLPAAAAVAAPLSRCTGIELVLVERDDLARDALRSALEGCGAVVHASRTAATAASWIRASERLPDVLVIGWHPDAGELRAVESLRQAAGYRVPVIIIATDPPPPGERTALPADIVMLSRPVSPARLAQEVQAAADRAAVERECT